MIVPTTLVPRRMLTLSDPKLVTYTSPSAPSYVAETGSVPTATVAVTTVPESILTVPEAEFVT